MLACTDQHTKCVTRDHRNICLEQTDVVITHLYQHALSYLKGMADSQALSS